MLSFNFKSIRESVRSFRGAAFTSDQNMGFWQGKQFRMYKVFNANTQLRFVCAKDFLLTAQTLYVDNGEATLTVKTGATPSGVWTPLASIIAKNRIGMNPVPVNIVEGGGTFTGGTEREVIRADSGNGAGVGFENRLPPGGRGLPAGTYYFDIVITGITAGIYNFEWEELDTVNGV